MQLFPIEPEPAERELTSQHHDLPALLKLCKIIFFRFADGQREIRLGESRSCCCLFFDFNLRALVWSFCKSSVVKDKDDNSWGSRMSLFVSSENVS